MSAAEGIAAGIALLAVFGALVVLMRRRPEAFPLLAILALPFRLPISADGRTVNLLLPLYLVIAAGTLVHLLRVLARIGPGNGLTAAEQPAGPQQPTAIAQPAGTAQPTTPTRNRPILLDRLLLASVVLYAVQSSYSSDAAQGP